MDNLIESIETGEARSENCGARMGEIGTGFHQFGEEIMSVTSEGGSSFTALLGLPPNQAVELLVQSPETDKIASDKLAISEPHYRYPPPPPIFPSDIALIDRASKFSVFAAAGNSPESNSTLSNSGSKSLFVKQEPIDSEFNHNSSPATSNPLVNQKSTKRKEREKKVKETSKKGKKSANDTSEDGGEKLPYVHVRARRGHATDSHSLAERCFKKIIDSVNFVILNCQYKCIQDLKGCLFLFYFNLFCGGLTYTDYYETKEKYLISGTAMVLDEIINHVQSLQRQVEFLSMRLAAVNPRVDFNLDSLFAAERSASHVESNLQDMVVPPIWAEGQTSGNRNQYQHLWHFEGFHQPAWGRLEDNSSFVTPENSLLTYDSSANSASLHPNQLKMEL
ncbi:hypothetical protein RDI58_025738 [Solanum bulbocastanum]|uniref:Uncharacterized protein n=1 Tax=Solanum bulbocastanum TaxID=147425 RepID=A0AAN8Y451_SOLBU